MRRWTITVTACLVSALVFAADETRLIDNMDDAAAWKSQQKGKGIDWAADPEPKEGKGAIRFDLKEGIFAIAYRQFKPDASWNEYDGLAFRVKGDGSENFGCIRVQAGNYDKGWVGNFPLADRNWHEVKLAWTDLVPTGATLPELGSAEGFKPGNIDLLAFGKSWNFTPKHERPALAFSVDDLRLVKGVKPGRRRLPVEEFMPVSEVVKKLKAGEPVTILALGDSITWGTDAGGNAHAYPAVLGKMLAKHYRNDKVTVISRAIGGSTTAHGRQWLIRDVSGIQADVVTVMFGFNERPPADKRDEYSQAFVKTLVTYVEEAAGLMKVPPAVVFLASIPGKDKEWETLDCYADAVRALGAKYRNVAVADVNGYFKKLGKDKYAGLMSGEAHPNVEGQKEMARVVFEAITGEKASAE